METLRGKHIVLGVTGSIAAYKALLVTRQLALAGAHVWPVLTQAATRFVAPLSFSVLAGHRAITDLWSAAGDGEVSHVELAHRADALLIAPATADTLARLAQGRADDPLGSIALATRAPLLVAPAMETGMWEHPATREHVATLTSRGVRFVAPQSGELASGRDGVGRLAEPDEIVSQLVRLLTQQDLAGEHLVVTAGPTREALDPARFVSNRSSGKMGFALARAAATRGATVRLITGPTALSSPQGVETTRIETTEQLLAACRDALPTCTALIMAAAPADYRAMAPAANKLKKRAQGDALTLHLVATPDILLALAARTAQRIVIGFAAESHELLPHARAKLEAKDLDLIVANDIGRADAGFEVDTNAVVLLHRDGTTAELGVLPKLEVAHAILDEVVRLRRGRALAE